MVFHAEGLVGIKSLSLTIQPVRGFENVGHHFPAAESALHAVDEPPADVPFLSLLPLLPCCCARSLPNRCYLWQLGDSILWLYSTCMEVKPRPHEIRLCTPIRKVESRKGRGGGGISALSYMSQQLRSTITCHILYTRG